MLVSLSAFLLLSLAKTCLSYFIQAHNEIDLFFDVTSFLHPIRRPKSNVLKCILRSLPGGTSLIGSISLVVPDNIPKLGRVIYIDM